MQAFLAYLFPSREAERPHLLALDFRVERRSFQGHILVERLGGAGKKPSAFLICTSPPASIVRTLALARTEHCADKRVEFSASEELIGGTILGHERHPPIFPENRDSRGFRLCDAPRHVLGGQGQTPPSEKLHVAGVGVGGMGQNNVRACAAENIVALCDVDANYAAKVFAAYPRPRCIANSARCWIAKRTSRP